MTRHFLTSVASPALDSLVLGAGQPRVPPRLPDRRISAPRNGCLDFCVVRKLAKILHDGSIAIALCEPIGALGHQPTQYRHWRAIEQRFACRSHPGQQLQFVFQ